MPKISVCVPVYNVEQYIGRCIESIQHQTLKDIEIIIVNDCTPDNSMQIVENYAIQDSRIKVINHESNKGLMWARRTGYMAAVGDYITFCDSDDFLPNDALQTLYNISLKTKSDIVSGDMQILFDNGTTKSWHSSLIYGSDKDNVYRALLTKKYSHNLCSKMFKKDLLQKNDYITLEHHTNGEDGMLFYQIMQHVKDATHINKIVYIYYQNKQSSTHIKLSELALMRLIDFYNYVIKIPYSNRELKYLAFRYAIDCVNEFALTQGYSKIKSIVEKNGTIPYLSFCYRLKYMTIKQNLRWYTKYILNLLQKK